MVLYINHVIDHTIESQRSLERMEQVVAIVDPLRQFAKDSVRLIKRCNKPDLKGKHYHDVHPTLPTLSMILRMNCVSPSGLL